MPERFFLPADLNAPELRLAGQEAHHLAHVLRLGPGGTVVLFDGDGNETDATIESVSKREVRLRSGPLRRLPPPTSVPITIAVAPPKGDRFRWLVEKATELGVSRLIPLITERTIVDPRERKLEKLRQTVIAACKQSRRCELMEIAKPAPFPQLCESLRSTPRANGDAPKPFGSLFPHRMPTPNGEGMPPADSTRAMILQPIGDPLAKVLGDASPSPTVLLIGPEGGFTDSEIERARSTGVQVASLGQTILRTETAAIAAAAIAVQDGLKVEG